MGRGKPGGATGGGKVGTSTGRGKGLLGGLGGARAGRKATGGAGQTSRGGALGKLTGGRLGRRSASAPSKGSSGKSSGSQHKGRRGGVLGKVTGGRLGKKAREATDLTKKPTETARRRPVAPTVAKTVRRPAAPGATGPAAQGVDPKAPVPAPAPRPGSTPAPTPAPQTAELVSTASHSGGVIEGGTTMVMKLGWIEASEEMLARANRWHVGPGEMTDAANQFAKESEQAAQNFAKALDIISRKMAEEQPLNRALPQIVAAASRAMRAVGSAVAPFGRAFQRLHAHEIQRQTAPRTNEKAWNPQS